MVGFGGVGVWLVGGWWLEVAGVDDLGEGITKVLPLFGGYYRRGIAWGSLLGAYCLSAN